MIPRTRFLPLLLAALAGLLNSGVGGGAASHAGPARLTQDPRPPLDLTVELVALQKNPHGGVATLLVKVASDEPMAEAVVSAKVPGDAVFSDGSASRTWRVDLTAAREQAIPVDVIASRDGTYFVSIEAEGVVRGQPVHRGAAHKLSIGVREKAPGIRGGAIEYPAVQGAGD